MSRTPRGAAIETALLVPQASSLSRHLSATQLGLLSAASSSFALAVTSLSMALGAAAGRRISHFEKKRRYDPNSSPSGANVRDM